MNLAVKYIAKGVKGVILSIVGKDTDRVYFVHLKAIQFSKEYFY